MNGWTRNGRTIGGADPTHVVTWSKSFPKGKLEIEEFQGIYTVVDKSSGHPTIDRMNDILGQELHQALEREFQAEQDEFWASQAEAGYPDDKIYGEP